MTTPDVRLREVTMEDVPVFFEHQRDADARHMAAFTTEEPADRDAFWARWSRILADDDVITRTILCDGRVAGHVARFDRGGDPEVTYWLGHEHWGRGVATKALALFLDEVRVRPIYARAAADNGASLRVLEKCGFARVGTDRGFAAARGADIDEIVMRLNP